MPLDLTAAPIRVESFATAAAQRAEVAAILLPPPDIDVAAAAELYRVLYNPGGGYSGPWRHEQVPYLVGPMQSLTDLRYEITVFVGPAQSAKSELGLNWMSWSVTVDPADFQIVLDEKDQAEDFSTRRIERATTHSPALADRLQSHSVFSWQFKGCLVNLAWPTSGKAASKPVPRNWLDERDSMGDDVGGKADEGGEGDPVDLFHKRSQTFGARRHSLVTSSPKRDIIRGAAKPKSAHEAPATTGVLALYNQGTRRLLHWPCPDCGGYQVTRFADLRWPEEARGDDAVIAVWIECPHCGAVIGAERRPQMLSRGIWVGEGQTIAGDGSLTGGERPSKVDSYWLFGPQAAFVTWEELVRRYLVAREEKDRSGSDTKLRAFWNVDAGEPYVPDADGEQPRDATELKSRAEPFPLGVVPAWACFVTSSVDNQADRFEVQSWAWGPHGEAALIDHYRIVARAGDRAVTTGGGTGGAESGREISAIDPPRRLEDWLLLKTAVLDRLYPLAGDPTRALPVVLTAIDTGGAPGATGKAYAFARWLRRQGLGHKAMFLKGAPGRKIPRLAARDFDVRTNLRTRAGASRQGVRLWHVAVDQVKDELDARLRRKELGPHALHLSAEMADALFEQLCVEERDGDKWLNPRHARNEAWDCGVYNIAAWMKLGGEKLNWANPPPWAQVARMAVAFESAPRATLAAAPPTIETPVARPAALLSRLRGRRVLHGGI